MKFLTAAHTNNVESKFNADEVLYIAINSCWINTAALQRQSGVPLRMWLKEKGVTCFCNNFWSAWAVDVSGLWRCQLRVLWNSLQLFGYFVFILVYVSLTVDVWCLQQLIDAVARQDVHNTILVLGYCKSDHVNTPYSKTDTRTALHIAAALGNLVLVQLLLWVNGEMLVKMHHAAIAAFSYMKNWFLLLNISVASKFFIAFDADTSHFYILLSFNRYHFTCVFILHSGITVCFFTVFLSLFFFSMEQTPNQLTTKVTMLCTMRVARMP